MKRTKPTYIDPYRHRSNSVYDKYEWGQISDSQLREQLQMIDLMQKYGVPAYTDREIKHIDECGDMVRPLKNMCVIINGGNGRRVAYA